MGAPRPCPTLAGFQNFIATVMGISSTVLPPSSPVIPMAFAVALEIVNVAINQASPLVYTLAVYNLGGSNLLNYAQDQPGAPPVAGSDPPLPFFAWTRKQWDLNGFVSGVVQSAGDQATSTSLIVQEAAKNFTLGDLQNLKDPYGRQYLAFAQRYGPTIVGVS